MKAKLDKIRCFLFDMDGTVYLGNQVLPGAVDLLKKLDAAKRQYYFLTNNSSRSQSYYRQKLAGMGIFVDNERIMSSAHSLLLYLASKKGKKLFVLGTQELKDFFCAAGYLIVEEGSGNPDYVVIGFDTGLNYAGLSQACQYVDAGVPYIATHPDVRCPLEGGKYIPDCGSIVALIKTATGKDCTIVTGKPSEYMLRTVVEKTGLGPQELAVVGDRLYTDIALGTKSGILSILVLSGEAKLHDIESSPYKPDLVLEGIYQLEMYL